MVGRALAMKELMVEDHKMVHVRILIVRITAVAEYSVVLYPLMMYASLQ